MSTKLAGPASSHRVILSRVFVIIFGCIGVIWGLVTLPVFWRQAPLDYIARQIIRGELYKPEILMRQLPTVEKAGGTAVKCRPTAVWSVAVIRLRLVEQASRDGVDGGVDAQRMKMLENSIVASLSCSPADPFLWLVLYWLETKQYGFKPDYFAYLRKSYELGPNEGWIILRRNPVAFAVFDLLPADLAANAVGEFANLIADGRYEEAAEIFRGPAWPVRDAILPKLASLPQRNREAFAQALYRRDLDASVPGVATPDSKRGR